MTDVMIRSLRVRGGEPLAFARAAARALPSALDRSLADIADVELDSLRVQLNVDPADVDEATLAMLWAQAIRAALLDAGAHVRRAGPDSLGDGQAGGPAASPLAAPPAATVLADALAGARAWLATPKPRPPVPATALRLMALVRGAGPIEAEFVAVAQRLAVELMTAVRAHNSGLAAGTTEAHAASVAEDPSWPDTNPQPQAEGSPVPTVPGEKRPSEGGESGVGPFGGPALPGEPAALALAEALASLAAEHGAAIDPARVTRAAGVVLLYPWLADLARAATDLHPNRDPAAVRAQAFALLAEPTNPDPADPLLAFLAGWEPTVGKLPPLEHTDQVMAAADDVLTSFARLLPGFAASSPQFVRQEWILRAGVLDEEREPARLVAAIHPLDVVLARLPYPLELFALPWSPMLTVRFVP